MAGRDIWTRLRQLDAYPKTLEDFRIKTFSGATGERTNTKGSTGQTTDPPPTDANTDTIPNTNRNPKP